MPKKSVYKHNEPEKFYAFLPKKFDEKTRTKLELTRLA